jgi:hypothetical protein
MYIWHLNPTIFTIFFLCTIPDCRYNDIQQQRLSVTSIITVTIFIYHFYLYTFDIQLRRHLPFSLLPLYVFTACSYQLRIPIRSTELRRTTFPHIHVLTKPFLFYTVLLSWIITFTLICARYKCYTGYILLNWVLITQSRHLLYLYISI